MTYTIDLDIYSGPFQLLLEVISEQRVEICDVPIARLTADYLSHIENMKNLDLEVTSEFLVVAATLLQLKARALLPRDPEAAEYDLRFDIDAERDLLIARLLEVRTFSAAGAVISDLLAQGDLRFSSAPAPDDEAVRQQPVLSDIDPAALGRLVADIALAGVRTIDVSLVISDPVSMEEADAVIDDLLSSRDVVTFREIVGARPVAWAVAIFLVMLERAGRGELRLAQASYLGEIEVSRAA